MNKFFISFFLFFFFLAFASLHAMIGYTAIKSPRLSTIISRYKKLLQVENPTRTNYEKRHHLKQQLEPYVEKLLFLIEEETENQNDSSNDDDCESVSDSQDLSDYNDYCSTLDELYNTLLIFLNDKNDKELSSEEIEDVLDALLAVNKKHRN